jgi:putative phosphoesterase
MTRIGLLSDTHNYLDDAVLKQLDGCDEIWHAGDFGNIDIADRLRALKPLKGVYGNIDGYDIRSEFPEQILFYCEEVKVFMKHIGGYPGRYAPGVKDIITKEQPQLFISGHSHIAESGHMYASAIMVKIQSSQFLISLCLFRFID